MTDTQTTLLEQCHELAKVLEALPELPAGVSVHSSFGNELELDIHGLGVEGLQALYTFGLEGDFTAQRDEYENLRNITTTIAGAEVTFYL